MVFASPFDSIVIGAGPAGLTAGIYLARFRRRVLVIDGGTSRAALVPVSHNLAGFPEGIRGPDLLQRMASQAVRYGAVIRAGTVEEFRQEAPGQFAVLIGAETLLARTTLLATGVVDVEPEMADVAGAVQRGLIRYCPVCDGYEVTGRRVGVIGYGSGGLNEALFLRSFSDDVTLFSVEGPLRLSDADNHRAAAAGIFLVEDSVAALIAEEEQIQVTAGGRAYRFDSIYSALGTKPRSSLACEIGATATDDGCLITSSHQQTSVEGVFAAGDIVKGLSQIGVAMGEAAVAATAIHNSLRGVEV